MKLKKQFKDFYDEICIHEESEDLKEKRDTLQKDIEDLSNVKEWEIYGRKEEETSYT